MSSESHIFNRLPVRHPAERRRASDGRGAVGLTGGVSSGKTTALRFFAELGARVLSADGVVHSLYERADLQAAIRARFGDEVIGSHVGVDRVSLARIVVSDEEAMRDLEALVHPLVSEEIENFIAGADPGSVVVCEVPLLVDVHAQCMFDFVVTIEAPARTRRERAVGRLSSDVFDHLDARLVGEAARRAAADAAYTNSGSVEDLRAFCALVYERARVLAAHEVGETVEDE